MTVNRRDLLALLAAPLVPGTMPVIAAEGTSLGAVAAAVGIAFGSAFDREVFDDADYRKLIASETRLVTAENALKFDWLRPKGPDADFSTADRIVEFARHNDLLLRGTTLVWNDNPPPWLRRSSLTELRYLFDRHIDETLTRYRGRIHSWDVVNEPFYPPQRLPGGYRQGPWYDAFGPAYIERAFRRAASVDPATRLVLNEAFCEQQDALGISVRAGLLKLVERLKGEGVPLHAIGLQGHLKPALPFDDQVFVEFLTRLAGFGVDLYITELDVDDGGMPDDINKRDLMVASRYRDFLKAVLTVPAVKAVITWQLSDRYSWYGELARRKHPPGRRPRPLPYDDGLQRKPAAQAMIEALLTRVK